MWCAALTRVRAQRFQQDLVPDPDLATARGGGDTARSAGGEVSAEDAAMSRLLHEFDALATAAVAQVCARSLCIIGLWPSLNSLFCTQADDSDSDVDAGGSAPPAAAGSGGDDAGSRPGSADPSASEHASCP